MKNNIVLKLKNVSKYYDNELIFRHINLEVKKGEIISIIGKSGCGKSTLLKCLNRLEEINDGEIILNEKNVKCLQMTELRQKIGIVFQDYNLFEHLTVLENLMIGLVKIKKYSINKSQKISLEILKKLDLIEKKDKYPDELSGGQKQRVAIARTVLMEPMIILLDEPTSALDEEIKGSILNLIKKLSKNGFTIIIVSHEESFVKKISDRLLKLTKQGLKEV